ncbi:hypothetical protein [Gimesia fumaroli]|uniref:SLA1 homology domain-containing protein n=1 Tax=Gimesia fumaroli TaxID=2527976 RepID=A0A518I6X9_9PLAN|nr:hypothetical protein [Gimesia fumaroli]QDV48846.1 hypothetical protein Enr17x_08600 [Gimesia fumaroli]
MKSVSLLLLNVLLLCLLLTGAAEAQGLSHPRTLYKQVHYWPATVVARPLPGEGEAEVVRVVKDLSGKLKTGDKILIGKSVGTKADSLQLVVTSSLKPDAQWYLPFGISPEGISEAVVEYVTDFPEKGADFEDQFQYQLKYLEHADPVIANDALLQLFAGSLPDGKTKLEYLKEHADQLPAEKLRKWVADQSIPSQRRDPYKLLFSFCGTPDDASLLKPTAKDDISAMGVAAWLILSGTKGLTYLDQQLIGNRETPPVQLMKISAALPTVHRLDDAIPLEALWKTNRLILERPSAAAFAIITGSALGDWSLLDQLMQLFETLSEQEKKNPIAKSIDDQLNDQIKNDWKGLLGTPSDGGEWLTNLGRDLTHRKIRPRGTKQEPTEEYNTPVAREFIVVYMLSCVNSDKMKNAENLPEPTKLQLLKARSYLKHIKDIDPKLVARVESKHNF